MGELKNSIHKQGITVLFSLISIGNRNIHAALGGFLAKELIDRSPPRWYSRVKGHISALI